MVPLAYAAVADFLFSFTGDEFGSGAAFNAPNGLAVNSTDFIIVGDPGSPGDVQIFDSTGLFIRALSGGTAFSNPSEIAVNSTGYIIVGDQGGTDKVEIYDRGGFFVRALSGGGVTFSAIAGVAVNSTGHIFVAEAAAVDLIHIYDKGGFFLKSLTGTQLGGVNFATVVDITIDSNDRLLVIDEAFNPVASVQIFDGNESFVTSFTGSSAGGTNWGEPSSIATDANNRIYILEQGSNPDNAQIFNSEGTSLLNTFTGTGTNGLGEAWNNVDGNEHITVDSNNRILVVDTGVNKVQIYEGFPLPVTTTSSGGGSDQQWKTKPTFGLDHNTFRPLVDGGFSFNGVSHDITDNWWTPFAEQKVKIGSTNTFTAKAYADKQLRVQEFLFGIPEVGYAHNAELGVEVVYDYSGEIEMINVVQKTDVIDIDSIKVVHTKSKCQSDDTVERCDTTRLSMKFLEPLKDKIMAIKGVDFKGRVHITYLNEGFDISGNSLNPMNTMMIPSTEKYEGLVEVTQTAKYSDIWTTQDDREFEMNTSGSFAQINQSFERHIDTGAFNRMHSEFADYKETQADNAITQLLEYCPTCLTSYADFKDSWAYEYPEPVDRLEVLYYLMIIEERKAIKVLDDAQFSIAYPKAEIDRDDRPLPIILAEERLMKKILADERAYLKQVLAPQQ